MFTRRFKRFGCLSIALLIAVTVAGCSDNGEGDEGACEEVNALKDSLTTLTQIEPVDDGMDALESATAEVKTDLEAAASAVASDLQPSVDEVQTAFDELETTLEGISSEGGLGAAATEVGNALTELGTASEDLSAEIGERC